VNTEDRGDLKEGAAGQETSGWGGRISGGPVVIPSRFDQGGLREGRHWALPIVNRRETLHVPILIVPTGTNAPVSWKKWQTSRGRGSLCFGPDLLKYMQNVQGDNAKPKEGAGQLV